MPWQSFLYVLCMKMRTWTELFALCYEYTHKLFRQNWKILHSWYQQHQGKLSAPELIMKDWGVILCQWSAVNGSFVTAISGHNTKPLLLRLTVYLGWVWFMGEFEFCLQFCTFSLQEVYSALCDSFLMELSNKSNITRHFLFPLEKL